MDNSYTQVGTYISIAGMLVGVLSHFGINATVDQIAGVLASIAILYGVLHQAVAHKNLAIEAGVYPTK